MTKARQKANGVALEGDCKHVRLTDFVGFIHSEVREWEGGGARRPYARRLALRSGVCTVVQITQLLY